MATVTRQQIIDAARSFVGQPYAHQGRGGDVGLDCVGLVIKVGHATGHSSFDFLAYSQEPDGETMEALLDEQMDKLTSANDAQPGDVVAMDFGEGIQHVGILLEKDPRGFKYSYIAHALRDHGVREGRPFGKYLKGITAAYEFRGVID